MSSPTHTPDFPHIILYDGACRLCNGTVDFVIKRDPKRHFQFAALESDAAKDLLRKRGIGVTDTEPQTIYLLEGSAVYTKSTAALRIATHLKWPWPVLYAGIILPRFLRNAVYDFVGARRTRWFGVTTTCNTRAIEEEKGRFIDIA